MLKRDILTLDFLSEFAAQVKIKLVSESFKGISKVLRKITYIF